jgi:hypothetical protein
MAEISQGWMLALLPDLNKKPFTFNREIFGWFVRAHHHAMMDEKSSTFAWRLCEPKVDNKTTTHFLGVRHQIKYHHRQSAAQLSRPGHPNLDHP